MSANHKSALVSTTPRIAIARDAGDLSIAIPGRPSWIMLFLIVWLCGWTVGGMEAMHRVLRPDIHPQDKAFMGFWLMGWAGGECTVLYRLLWMLGGMERLSVRDGMLTQWRGIGPLGRTRRFDIMGITHLVLAPRPRRRNRELGYSPYALNLAFDYGTRSWWIASDADEAESRAILAALETSGMDPAR